MKKILLTLALLLSLAPLSTSAQTVLPVVRGGTGAATFSSGRLIYGVGTGALQTVATTSASCSGTVSCSAFTVIGASPITITGSGGSSGTVSTSTSETSGRVPFWTTTSATPALLSGGVSGFTFDSTLSKLTVTAASTTASQSVGTALWVSGNSTTTSTGLTTTGGIAVNQSDNITAGVVNVGTGFRIANAATSANVLRGNGTNFVSSALAAADLSNGVTGSGSVVLGTGPTITLANGTGLPVSTGISGLGTGVATFLATPSSANLATAVTDETGSGVLVFGTTPTFTTSIFTPLIVGGNAAGSTLTLKSTSASGTTDAIILQVGNNGATEAARVTTGGLVGIGTTTPAAKLDVAGVLGSQADVFNVSSTTATNVVSPLFTVKASGKVGIGTSAPGATLTTNGTASSTTAIVSDIGTCLGSAGKAVQGTSGTLSCGTVVASDTSSTTRTVFTSSGTWTKPTGLKWVVIEVQGSGAGGGVGNGADASGGGAGCWATQLIPAAALGSTETVTVGAAVAFATNGNASVFGTTPFITANGGTKGTTGSNTRGGIGGTCTGGDYSVPGQEGGFSIGTVYRMGDGGNSHLGMGGRGNTSNSTNNESGVGYGAGGAATTNANGGGTAGIVIVNEYY